MTKHEFENEVTAKVNNGIGGGVSPATWEEIEMVYMNTDLAKTEVADLFWNHTGRWSKIAYAVKIDIEARKNLDEARSDLAKAQGHFAAMSDLADKASKLTKKLTGRAA